MSEIGNIFHVASHGEVCLGSTVQTFGIHVIGHDLTVMEKRILSPVCCMHVCLPGPVDQMSSNFWGGREGGILFTTLRFGAGG